MDSVATLLKNFNELAPQFYRLLNAAFYLIGAALALFTAFEIKAWQEGGGRVSFTAPLFTFLAACFFLFLPETVNTLSTTFFGSQTNILADRSDAHLSSAYMEPILRFVEIVGFVAVGRAWLILRDIGKGRANEGATGRVTWHAVGGVAAINITTLAPIIGNFAGVDLSWMVK